MGAKSGAALKFLQWFLRGVQFACSALILGVYSYFLAALHNHNLNIDDDVRAVEGISGAAVLYTLIGLLLLCCLAGRKFTSLIAIVLDLAFIGAFIYVAIANRDGASDCRGYLDTPFGRGQSGDTVDSNDDGFTALPSFHTACRLQTACLAVAIVAIIFFVLSILTEVALVRHHSKAKRFGPGPQNNYTSGYGKEAAAGGLFSRIFRRKKATTEPDENALPVHTTPEQFDNRQSYATETTAVNNVHDNPYNPSANKHETGYGYPTHNAGVHPAQQTGFQTQQTSGFQTSNNYRYEDGVYDRV